MKRLIVVILFALLASLIFPMSGTPGSALAGASGSCIGIAKAIFRTPLGPAFDKMLQLAVEQSCGAAMDIGALKILYANTGGTNWFEKANWITTQNHCSWYGVSCDLAGRVSGLELEKNNLLGAIPPELGLLSNLVNLQLAQNQLSGSLPAQLGTLSSLSSLDLSENQLSGPIPPELGDLSSLVTLDLHSNQLSGSIPPELGQIDSLERLDLGNNHLSESIPGALFKLPNLMELLLSDNQLSGSIPTVLGSLTNTLTVLDLANNQLSGYVPSVLGKLTSLAELRISNNPLAGPLPLSLMKLVNLQTFYFNETNLCEPANPGFQTWLAGIPDLEGTQACLPVIVLPGVMGSKLFNSYEPFPNLASFQCWTPLPPFPPVPLLGALPQPTGLVWLDLEFPLFNSAWALYKETLELRDGEAVPLVSCNNIYTDPAQDQAGVDDRYAELIVSLREAGYEARFFPYDWRLGLEFNAERLDAQIDAWGYAKVNLVGHSMGGLLARTYIATSAHAEKVEKVISVGSPYLGSPDLTWEMRTGAIPDVVFEIGGVEFGIADASIYNIIRNSPGMMQLLPSNACFTSQQVPYYQIEGNPLSSLAATNEFFKTNWGAFIPQNGRLLDEAAQYHDIYDNFSNISVEYHILSAANYMTRYKINQKYQFCPLHIPPDCFQTVGYFIGDGTVPWNSATQIVAPNMNVTIHDSYQLSEMDSEHGTMVQNTLVISDIQAILAGIPTSNDQKLTAMVASSPPSYIQLTVSGSTEVSISDGVHFTGVDENGVLVNDIPGATYQATGYQTEVVLPSDQAYTVTFKQTGDIPLQVKVSELTAPSFESLFTANQQAVFVDVPLNAGGVAALSLDLSAGLDSLLITIDQNSDGLPDQSVPASSLLDARQSQDYSLPATNIAVDGTQNLDGSYAGEVTITLTAEDAETGVLKTQYSLDGGLTWLDYQAPVIFQAEQLSDFSVRSVDKAGNTEYPYPSLNLNP
jgi:pimeloyl-ACP methyl ester carboxylesterase